MEGIKFQHLGLAVQNLEAALKTHEAIFGCRLLSGPFIDPIQEAKVAFVGTGVPGDLNLELVAPLSPESHVAKLLAKGLSSYHICCEVDDLDATIQDLRGKGCLVFRDPAPAVAFGGRRIAWFMTPTRQMIELVERGH